MGHFSDDAETLEFVDSQNFRRLAALGTSCPDHFLRTKIAPLALDPDRISDSDYIAGELATYRDQYAAYYKRCAKPQDPAMRDPNPIVVLVPGIGRFTLASDKTTARLAGEFYANAINVMRGAEALGGYVGLDELEAFRIEYWALEEAKLRRMPPPKPLAGRIALVTGAAGGIGAASARRLLEAGACVILTDRDEAALEQAGKELTARYGRDLVRTSVCDVTSEDQVRAAFDSCCVEFGGLDILVANAGLASSASLEETTVALWRKNYDVLVEGYFLAARAAFPLMRLQRGGSIVFIGSKNALAATPNASAYASAKAASVHLARCLAMEGAGCGHPCQHSESGRSDQGLPDLGWRLAQGARQRLWHRPGRGARDILPRAFDAQAERAARGHRRSRVFLCHRRLGQIHRPTSSTSTQAMHRHSRAEAAAKRIKPCTPLPLPATWSIPATHRCVPRWTMTGKAWPDNFDAEASTPTRLSARLARLRWRSRAGEQVAVARASRAFPWPANPRTSSRSWKTAP